MIYLLLRARQGERRGKEKKELSKMDATVIK